MPLNKSIWVNDGAKIEANGSIFTSTNSSSSVIWNSIYLVNPGNSIISGCFFYNSANGIASIDNNNKVLVITNNEFRNNLCCIHIERISNTLISDNVIWLPSDPYSPSCGLCIINGARSEDDNNMAPNNPRIDIINSCDLSISTTTGSSSFTP